METALNDWINDLTIVDGHQDLAYNMLSLGRDYRRSALETRAGEKGKPASAGGQSLIGLPELLAGNVAVVFGTLFTMPAHRGASPLALVYENVPAAHEQAMAQLDVYHRWADEEAQFALVGTRSELDAVLESWQASSDQEAQADDPRRVGILPLMENADPIREPAELELWFERGVRIVGPAWTASRYAGGTGQPGPLTDLGHELLDVMADLGVALDLSHLSERAAVEALDRFEGVVLASHSNPQGIVPGDRQLNDTLIQRLAERDGVIGITLYNGFLRPGWRKGNRKGLVTLTDVVRAIDYVCQRIGDAQHVALGSDFDGGFGREAVPAELETVADLRNIAAALAEHGFTMQHIANIMGGNWLRLLRRLLPA